MKLTINRDHLHAALAFVARTVKVKQDNLQCVLIEAEKDAVTISAHGFDVCAKARADAECKTTGSALTNHAKLYSMIECFPKGETVEMSLDGILLTIKCGRSRYKLTTLPVTEFPAMFDKPEGHAVELSKADVSSLLGRPVTLLEKSDERPLYQGIYLHTMDSRLHAIGSDGARALRTGSPVVMNGQRPIMLGREAIADIARFDVGRISWNDHIFCIESLDGSQSYLCKMLESKWSDYTQRLPRIDGIAPLEFARTDLVSAMHRLAIMSTGYSVVKMAWKANPKEATLSFVKDGNGDEIVPCQGAVEAGEICVYPAGFSGLLNELVGETLCLHITGPHDAFRVSCPAEPDTIAVQAAYRL